MIIPPFILDLIWIGKDQIGAWKRYQFAYTFMLVYMHMSASGFAMLSLPSLYWFDSYLCLPSTIFNFSSSLSVFRALPIFAYTQSTNVVLKIGISMKLVSQGTPHLRWENTIYLFLCVYFLCSWGYTSFPWCLKNSSFLQVAHFLKTCYVLLYKDTSQAKLVTIHYFRTLCTLFSWFTF